MQHNKNFKQYALINPVMNWEQSLNSNKIFDEAIKTHL